MNAPDQLTQSCFDTLLAATAADDYEQFISVGDKGFQIGIEPEIFHQVSQDLAPRMQKGFTPAFLGELRQGGCKVSLWQLAFADGKDNLLMRMSMAGGKVNGALISPAFA